MKRIGKYLITAVGFMTLGGTPALFARERCERRIEVRRYEDRRFEVRHDRDWYYRRGCR